MIVVFLGDNDGKRASQSARNALLGRIIKILDTHCLGYIPRLTGIDDDLTVRCIDLKTKHCNFAVTPSTTSNHDQ